MTYKPAAPAIIRRPEQIADETWLIHQVQEALGAPLRVYLNSMVIRGAEPIIVDTGTVANRAQWLDDVFGLVDPADVHYVFLSHDDVDHTGNLAQVMEHCPNATLLASWALVERFSNAFAFPLHRCRWVDDGSHLDLDDRRLQFVRPPLWDSPTTRGVFDSSTDVYWAVDAFATPCSAEVEASVDELDPEAWRAGVAMFAHHAIGVQTAQVLAQVSKGVPWSAAAPQNDERRNGNGALMRVLPLALWHLGPDEELVRDARLQSRVTHGHLRSQLCCALYCLWARRLLYGSENAYSEATDRLHEIVSGEREAVLELDQQIRPREDVRGTGSGYVVDTLHTVRAAMGEQCYERAVQRAISFGDDTDTTAALAGGLAGVRDGADAIPRHWALHEDGKALVQPLLIKLLEHRGVHVESYY